MTVTITCYNKFNDRCHYFGTEELLLFCAAVALMAAALAIWGHWQHSRVGPVSWCWSWRVEWAHLKLPMFAGSSCWSLKVLYQMHRQGAPLTLLLVSAVWARFTMIQKVSPKSLGVWDREHSKPAQHGWKFWFWLWVDLWVQRQCGRSNTLPIAIHPCLTEWWPIDS